MEGKTARTMQRKNESEAKEGGVLVRKKTESEQRILARER